MKRLTLSMALLATLVAAPGCLTTISEAPTQADVSVTGPYPDDYEAIVRKWVLSDLFRIVSIDDLRVTKPEAGMTKPLIGSDKQGWRAEVAFWGRDRIGTATGRMDYTVLIRDGKVVAEQRKP